MPALPSGAAHTAYLPAPAVAEVSLTGLSLSLTDVVGLLDNVNGGGLLGNLDLGGLLGNFDLGNLDLGGLDLGNLDLGGLDLGNLDLGGLLGNLNLGDLLGNIGGLSPGLARAVLVEFIKEVSPVVKTAAGDVFQYVTSSVGGLVIGPDSIPVQFASAIGEIPAVVKTAFGELKDLDFLAALQTLNQGLLAPIRSIGQVLLETANGIRTYVTSQVGTLVDAIPGILMSAIAAVIGNNGQGLLDTIKNLIGGLLPGAATPAASLVVAPKAAAAVASDTATVSEAAPVVDAEAPAAVTSRAPRAAAASARTS
ncbi:MAG: hypothetical protein KIH64_003300, partial [Mycobacterium sp.]|nr:hypothetical protein [Mycobacterium sp.]